MILLSITGLFKMVLIILGVMVVLRVIGQLMIARRNADAERDMLQKERESQRMSSEARKNLGKTTISRIDKKQMDQAEYTDFEEVD